MKKRVRADDLVKTPVSHDMSAPCCCNPPALLLSLRGMDCGPPLARETVSMNYLM